MCSASVPPHLTTRSARPTTSRSPLNPFQPSYLARLMLLLLSFSHQKQQMPFGSCLFGKFSYVFRFRFYVQARQVHPEFQTRIPTTRRRPRSSKSSLQLDSVHVLAGQRLDLAEWMCGVLTSWWFPSRWWFPSLKSRWWFPGSWRGLPGSEWPSAEEGLWRLRQEQHIQVGTTTRYQLYIWYFP